VYDYFSNISRIKSFHKIEKINDLKILSYTAYWLLELMITTFAAGRTFDVAEKNPET
jgi:hypothetical protein